MRKFLFLTCSCFLCGLLWTGINAGVNLGDSVSSLDQDVAKKNPLVIVSIAPYKYFVEKITAGAVDVKTIVPEGVNSHTYEPSPRSLSPLVKADIWFQVGDSFENKLAPVLLEKNPNLKIYDLRSFVSLIYTEHNCCHSHNHSHEDRAHNDAFSDVHTWMDPKNALMQCEAMYKILSKHFPELSFTSSYEDLKTSLETLDEEIAFTLRNSASLSFVTSHPSFAYFCKRYN